MKLSWHTEERKIKDLIPWNGNPRRLTDDQAAQLQKSLEKFDLVEIPAIDIDNRLIAGHQRIKMLLLLNRGDETIDVRVPSRKLSEEEFKEYNIRSNHTIGEWDEELLATFGESFLKDIGFDSIELDDIFAVEDNPEEFNLEAELKKLDIQSVTVEPGDIYELDGSRLMCGNSMVEEDMLKLMGDQKANMCLTDPPYILDYLNGKRRGEPTDGFGYKKDRRYLGTDELPPDFTERWIANIKKVANDNFAIIVYENWKNLRTIWEEMEKYWKIKNMIVWHLENRHQGFSAKHKFFSKHDIAMVAGSGEVAYNLGPEEGPLEEEYETALFAIGGKPQWESYESGKKLCPTDHITFRASDEKHSGQGVVFGTKPVEILIPYLKVLTKRGDLIVEPFGGSGSTLIAALKMNRRCYVMEKSPVYTEVILKRWELATGHRPTKIM